MAEIKNKEFYEKIKNKFKKLNLMFSILSVLAMLAHPTYSIIVKKGNLYVNIAVLIVSIIYGIFWLYLGSKKAHKINRIYKWSKLLLNAVSLSINAYSIYITATNFNLPAIFMSIVMGTFWVLNFIFNLFYDIASAKFNKFVESAKENLNELKNKYNFKKNEVND